MGGDRTPAARDEQEAGGMTATDAAVPSVLRRAARRGASAWSVCHTQPWRFELHPDHVDLVADPSRRLEALDASGRLQTASLGAALYDLRVSLAAAGHRAHVERLPEPRRPDLVARVWLGPDGVGDGVDPIAADEPMLDDRRAEAGEFTSGRLSAAAVAAFDQAAADEGTPLLVAQPEAAARVHALCRQARDIQLVDPACRAELKAWTGSVEREPEYADPATAPGLLIIGGAEDDRTHWVRAGETLERLLLVAVRHGLVAAATGCVLEVPVTRLALREDLGLSWYPQLVVRIGRGKAQAAPHRRRLVDVLFEGD
ncbi:MAG: hypothetical protein ACTHMS_07880 [Jatrophihabitans sp.]|uniref:hypothetical protein n=1 Tax=Jatrophihabitans sp. TaxID=1932789 RepID=UPI003F7DA0ED